ncbi:MAG TPA: hypothetical protein VHC40_04920 [Rhizomicrobium sp.]|uniref:hypothetical protein n=1 Tax=Enhydrobacter aerosaccus TaxID=225324 RepID=UPI00111649BA|nr:hypothetical protein [Enhydrobacter aerosaccus]HVV27288.1 hypothetical protein [Rhizomicrobium sp.]
MLIRISALMFLLEPRSPIIASRRLSSPLLRLALFSARWFEEFTRSTPGLVGGDDDRQPDAWYDEAVRALLALSQSMVTVFLETAATVWLAVGQRKIDRSMPIVAEAIHITDRRNSCLKSKARISDGSGRRFFVALRKNLRLKSNTLPWLRIIEWE